MARMAPFVTFVALNAIKRAASNRDRASTRGGNGAGI
jgi:hypothetical protein